MSGTTISTPIGAAITLGSAGYVGLISITKSGAIEPAQLSATALTVPGGAADARVTNHGLIVGGYANTSGQYHSYGTPGGDGVQAGAGAIIVNNGTILGGGSAGSQYTNYAGGFNGGGTAVDLYGAQARLTNNAVIAGGADRKGGGGLGVSVSSGAIVINNGIIAGGAASGEGGHGGIGVVVQNATLVNYGTIEAGDTNAHAGEAGTDGVVLSAGKVTNRGVIIGGAGGAQDRGSYGYIFGTGGVGVTIAVAGSTLVNDAKIYGGIGNKAAGIGGTGVAAYGASTIINKGVIAGGKSGAVTHGYVYVYTGVGGDGVVLSDGASLTNHGAIIGGAGGAKGSYGGDGAVLTYSSQTYLSIDALANDGVIVGGAGGHGAGVGGAGIVVQSFVGNVSNRGVVRGGLGGGADYNAGSGTTKVNGGEGGAGLFINASPDPSVLVTGTNTGSIFGGNGGAAGMSGLMGHGGTGLVLSGKAQFTNAGVIRGGNGGAAEYGYQPGCLSGGGFGVLLAGAVKLVNIGTIAAGDSEESGSNGSAGIYDEGVAITNRGLIVGGTSGAGTANYAKIQSEGNNGGIGLVQYGGTSVNFGTIRGGAGGNAGPSASYFGAHGGYGVRVRGVSSSPMYQAKFHNYGTIIGGAGGINTLKTGQEGLGGTGAYIAAYVSFTNSGLIAGGGDASFGIFLADKTGSVSNTGTIASGTDGTGVFIEAGSFTNGGTIFGDFAAAYVGTYVLSTDAENRQALTNSAQGLIAGGDYLGTRYGAFGAVAQSFSSLSNAGTIIGGTNEATVDGVIKSQQGGIGVALDPNASATNTGFIMGGSAGPAGNNPTGAGGGTAVSMTDYQNAYNGGSYNNAYHTVLLNRGQIIGAAGDSGSEYGGAGGIGVHLTGGTLFNAGTITGGAGGYGKLGSGQAGDAVFLGSDSTLVVENGAVFNGLVVARNDMGNDVLRLAGQSAKPLAGIGSQITGFYDIDFASNAAWTISGDTAGLASDQTIDGFTSRDAIELTNAAASSGQVNVGTAGIVTITAGGDTYQLEIAGAPVGETNFSFSNDTLRESAVSAAPAMTFLRPAQPAAASPSLFTVPGLDHFMSVPGLHASLLSGTQNAALANHPSVTTALHIGAIQDLSRPPQGEVRTLVTLHA